MRPGVEPVCAATLAAALLLAASPVIAANTHHVAYEAPPGCPGWEALRARIAWHAPDHELVADSPASADVVVRISESGGAFEGAIVSRQEPDGRRVVPGASCSEVVNAAALVVAILIDPEGVRRLPPGPADAVEPAPAPGGDVAPATPSSSPTVASPPPPFAGAPDRQSAAVPRAAAPRALPWIFGIGAEVAATWVLSPSAAPLAGVGLNAESTEPGVLSPWFRVSGHYGASPLVTNENGAASFQLLSGRATGCPVRLPVGSGAWAAPCVFLEAGHLSGVADDRTKKGKSAGMTWGAAGAALRMEGRLGAAYAAAVGGATLPFLHDRFYLDPGRLTLRQVPVFAPFLGVEAGARFP